MPLISATSHDHSELLRAFAHAETGLAITDLAGNCVALNPSYGRLLALAPDAVRKANLFTLIHPEDRSAHQALLDQLLAGAIPGFTIKKRYLRADGSSIWVRNSVSACASDDDQHLIHICEDINHHKRLEQAIEAQDKLALLGRLASSIVHEIANPLENMRNLLYLAQEHAAAKELRDYFAAIDVEMSQVAHIATQTLQFHRQAPQPVEVNIEELVESVLTVFRSRIKAAKIDARIETRDKTVLACVAVEVRQVVANLISNAADSMGNGGILCIRIRTATDWRNQQPGVRITIADTGTGMSVETRKHIYESFFTTKGVEGTGLGLWVTSNIVKRYGGSIHVRSRQHGEFRGTTFTVIFPKTMNRPHPLSA